MLGRAHAFAAAKPCLCDRAPSCVCFAGPCCISAYTKGAAELAQCCSVSLVDLLTGRVTYTRNANGSGAAYDSFALQPRSFIAAGDASGALATSGAAS